MTDLSMQEAAESAAVDATLYGLGVIGFNNAEHPMAYYRIPPESVVLAASQPPSGDHIGCQFNHAHRWPECYDDAASQPPSGDALHAAYDCPECHNALATPAPLEVAGLRAKLLQMANVAAEKRPMTDVARGYERACDELLEWLAASAPSSPDYDHEVEADEYGPHCCVEHAAAALAASAPSSLDCEHGIPRSECKLLEHTR